MTRVSLLSTFAPLLVVGFVAYRQLKEKRVKMRQFWLMPVLMGLATLSLIQHDLGLLHAQAVAILVGCFLMGGILGLLRGRLVKIQVLRATGELVVTGSLADTLIWGGIFALKALVRQPGIMGGSLPSPLLTAYMLVFALGMIVGKRGLFAWKYFTTDPREAPALPLGEEGVTTLNAG